MGSNFVNAGKKFDTLLAKIFYKGFGHDEKFTLKIFRQKFHNFWKFQKRIRGTVITVLTAKFHKKIFQTFFLYK
jgi:regulator of RNase E activity RraA